jgi:hypothetical protein
MAGQNSLQVSNDQYACNLSVGLQPSVVVTDKEMFQCKKSQASLAK